MRIIFLVHFPAEDMTVIGGVVTNIFGGNILHRNIICAAEVFRFGWISETLMWIRRLVKDMVILSDV